MPSLNHDLGYKLVENSVQRMQNQRQVSYMQNTRQEPFYNKKNSTDHMSHEDVVGFSNLFR